MSSLRKASELDPELALEVIADQTVDIVTAGMDRGYWTYGICQAVIHAFAVGALIPPEGSSLDMAFAVWDEAFAVIDDRAPTVRPTADLQQMFTYRPRRLPME